MIRNIDTKGTIRKGGTQGGQTGHRQNTANGKVKYLHGNGCREGGQSCFECKFTDCVWDGK